MLTFDFGTGAVAGTAVAAAGATAGAAAGTFSDDPDEHPTAATRPRATTVPTATRANPWLRSATVMTASCIACAGTARPAPIAREHLKCRPRSAFLRQFRPDKLPGRREVRTFQNRPEVLR